MHMPSIRFEPAPRACRQCLTVAALGLAVLGAAPVLAQDSGTIDPGETGFDVKRPVLASACEHGCPWGELGDFVRDAMKPGGYEVILCRNCNRDQGPPLVSTASKPPALGVQDTFVGTTTRVDAPVDFGITESGLLAWAYHGRYNYEQHGPYENLRLIAKIEDPTYLLVAVKADSDITDLSQIADQKRAVMILGGDSPIAQPVLDHYGLTQDAVTSWGGSIVNAILGGQADDPSFDVVISELASPSNNPESAFWSKIAYKHALRFLDVPKEVIDRLADDDSLGVTRATVKWGFLPGVDREIPTVARSGHAVFARDDMPDDDAYAVAKAIDEHRDGLKWYIRPYSYDSRSAWKNMDVPLHPGAERYYREMGYMTDGGGTSTSACARDGGADASAAMMQQAKPASDSGCSAAGPGRASAGQVPVAAAVLGLLALLARRRRRQCAS